MYVENSHSTVDHVFVHRPAFYFYGALKLISAVLMLTIDLEFKAPAKNVVHDVMNVLKKVEILALFFTCFILGQGKCLTLYESVTLLKSVLMEAFCHRIFMGIHRKLLVLGVARFRCNAFFNGYYNYRWWHCRNPIVSNVGSNSGTHWTCKCTVHRIHFLRYSTRR